MRRIDIEGFRWFDADKAETLEPVKGRPAQGMPDAVVITAKGQLLGRYKDTYRAFAEADAVVWCRKHGYDAIAERIETPPSPRRPGRPSIGKALYVRFPDSTHEMIEEVAAEEGIEAQAEMIRILVEEALETRRTAR